ncbi:MAG: hypothetical protein JRH17_12970 [Deltaproteobacteria bacterium]|nr:hypothetical protein [Deltaproteobacteria bacterium]
MLDSIIGTGFLLLLIYASLAVAVPLAERMLGSQGPLLRTLAVATLSAVHLTLVFHILLFIGAFDRVSAAAVLLATIVVVRLSGPTHRELGESIRRDLRPIRRVILAGRWKPARLVYVLGAFFATVTIARSFMLPTVGWDSMTYHFVKAGMWVQTGGPILMRGPGGWDSYRSFFGGGEIFTAWAMLPFGNDLLACGVDLAWWGLSALALYALGREFGLRVRHRLATLIYASFLPAVWDAVGWGYVDLAGTALSLIGLVFAIRYFRTRSSAPILLAILALGLASGVKLTSFPFLGLVGAILLTSVVLDEKERRRRLGYLLVGVGVTVLIVGPWLLGNFLETGYPLSLPITLAGIQLGPDNPASTWFGEREFAAYTFQAELNALRGIFSMPSVNESHLSRLSLLPLVLTPFGFVRTFRRRPDLRPALGLTLCLILTTLLFFYSPAFSVVRLEFDWTNGRFLVPLIMVCLVVAFAALPLAGRWRDGFCGYLLVGALVHFYYYGPIRLSAPSVPLVAIGTIAAAISLCVLAYLALARAPRVPAIIAVPVLLLVASLALAELRMPEMRYRLLANRNVPAEWFRYWWVAARMLDEEPGSHRVAVTGGDWQDGDNWLMYYFMGGNLQSTLHYIPISIGGEFIPFGPGTRRRDGGAVDAWLERIVESRISHVMSFVPSSLEITWMNARPDRFVRVTGHEDRWALFRVLRGGSVELRPQP